MDVAMSDTRRVAVVSGANRGIGLETCRELAKRGLQVVLTSRDSSRGEQAVAQLAEQGITLDHHQLDVCDQQSVRVLAADLRERYGRLDVLINNAGAVFEVAGSKGQQTSILDVGLEAFEKSFATNALGALSCCQQLLPLMRENEYGRIVNLSTGLASLAEMAGGWPSYRVSKAALNALTRIFAAELEGTNIKVNSVCPGWVQTDMGGPDASCTIEDSIDTIIWLATLRDDGPSGGFFRDCKQIPW